MRLLAMTGALSIGLVCGLERLAAACPFCGGKGASGLLENLIMVAVFWFGARSLRRAAKRRRSRDLPAPQSGGEPRSSTPPTTP